LNQKGERKMDKAVEFKNIVAQYTEIAAEDMTDEMRFREDLGFSSLDFMSFLGELEDTFDVELEQEDALEVRTLGEALEMLDRLTEE
jgi:acyl carrier protein